jgi:hypothetical protein
VFSMGTRKGGCVVRCVMITAGQLVINAGGVCRRGFSGLPLDGDGRVHDAIQRGLEEGMACWNGVGKLCMRAMEVYDWMQRERRVLLEEVLWCL